MKILSGSLKWLLLLGGIVLMMCSSPTKDDNTEITVSISDVWFSDMVDNDGDSYNSYIRLNFDPDVSEGVISVFVKLGLRITDPSNVAPFTLYLESTDFSITGSGPADAVFISIGIPNQELSHGNYDFALQIFSSANPNRVMDEVSSVTNTELKNVALETTTEDVNVLTEWISRTDGIFEGGACYFGVSDPLSTAWYAISLDQPAGAQSCVIKKIRINIFSNPSYGKLRVWGKLQSLMVPNNLEIYAPATSMYLNNGSNVFDVEVDATLYDPFYVGYLQTQADQPQLSFSTEYPVGTFGQSRYYKNGVWNLVRTNEFGIDVYVEYTDSTGNNLSKPVGRWLNSRVSSSADAE